MVYITTEPPQAKPAMKPILPIDMITDTDFSLDFKIKQRINVAVYKAYLMNITVKSGNLDTVRRRSASGDNANTATRHIMEPFK